MMPRLPRAGFVSRMRVYLAEMLPIGPALATALLASCSLTTILARIHGVPPQISSPHTILGGASVFGVMLILRLMDELKDGDVDRALFPERPLPSGRVLEEDVRVSLAGVVALYLLAHAWAGTALVSAAVVLGYAFLMFRWFFVPEMMRPRLPLTLVTHTPVIPLLLLHLLVLFAVGHGMGLGAIRWIPSLLAVALHWLLLFAWEISRKIRSREEENAYVTYSRLLGARGAVALAALVQALALAVGLGLYEEMGLSPRFVLGLVGGWAVALVAHARFALHPSPATSRLRPFAEADVVCALIGGCLA
jgi:4-hydroxybenzoate polyprenyltransferase